MSSVPPDDFDTNVFVNCPFDKEYTKLLRSVLFVILHYGYTPRLASETSDSGQNRLAKICDLIASCRYSIHDLSRIRSSRADEFSRMNMPFELGIDFGTRLHGPSHAAKKRFLILEKHPHDFKIALSDLAGIDIKAHSDKPVEVNRAVRDWFYDTVGLADLRPKPQYWAVAIWSKFSQFVSFLLEERIAHGASEKVASEEVERMPISEFIDSARDWIASNAASEDVSTR